MISLKKRPLDIWNSITIIILIFYEEEKGVKLIDI